MVIATPIAYVIIIIGIVFIITIMYIESSLQFVFELFQVGLGQLGEADWAAAGSRASCA